MLLGLIFCLSLPFGSEKADAVQLLQPDSVTSDQLQENRNFTDYTVRRDFRKCLYPLCGGYFVKEANRRTTRCVDGSSQSKCYVTGIDWTKSDLPPKQIAELEKRQDVLLRGGLRSVDFDGFGSLGEVDQAPDIPQADPIIYPFPIYPFCPDAPVTVPEQGGVEVSINCDTGIR